MATPVPDLLKKADISRFATRAAQIEKAKPAIAYWCYYWIVQQIVTKGLHNASEETLGYTTGLMDKLEVAKATDDDGIKDELAAKALIEQFGLEVFSRADNAVLADKVTKQTADTFQAAYTFLELLQIWPPLDAEVAAKIKYAKYHALRIVKAIKNGEDPNLSNPKPDLESQSAPEARLDPNDPEVRALQGATQNYRASVEDVPDEDDYVKAPLTGISTTNQSTRSSRDVSANRQTSPYDAERYYSTSKDVSPIGPPSNAAPPSVGGGYFPRPNDLPSSSGSGPLTLPSAPADASDSLPDMTSVQPLSTSVPSDSSYSHALPSAVFHPQVPAASQAPSYYQQPPTHSAPAVVDDVAITQAQKHARWAVSALNFEDIPTAIKEFQSALELLGARGPW